MKKYLSIIMLFVMILSGCSGSSAPTPQELIDYGFDYEVYSDDEARYNLIGEEVDGFTPQIEVDFNLDDNELYVVYTINVMRTVDGEEIYTTVEAMFDIMTAEHILTDTSLDSIQSSDFYPSASSRDADFVSGIYDFGVDSEGNSFSSGYCPDSACIEEVYQLMKPYFEGKDMRGAVDLLKKQLDGVVDAIANDSFTSDMLFLNGVGE